MAYISKDCLTCRHCVIRDLLMRSRTQTLTDKYNRSAEVLAVVAPVTMHMCLHHGIYLPEKPYEYVCDDWETFAFDAKGILRRAEE